MTARWDRGNQPDIKLLKIGATRCDAAFLTRFRVEFAILLRETDQRKVMEVAKQLRLVLANVEVPLEHRLPSNFTVSIDVAVPDKQT